MINIISLSHLGTRFPKGSLSRVLPTSSWIWGTLLPDSMTLPRKSQAFFGGPWRQNLGAEYHGGKSDWYPWCAPKAPSGENPVSFLASSQRGKLALSRCRKMGLRHQRGFENRSASRPSVDVTRTLYSNCWVGEVTEEANFYYFLPPLFTTNAWVQRLSPPLSYLESMNKWICSLYYNMCIYYFFIIKFGLRYTGWEWRIRVNIWKKIFCPNYDTMWAIRTQTRWATETCNLHRRSGEI